MVTQLKYYNELRQFTVLSTTDITGNIVSTIAGNTGDFTLGNGLTNSVNVLSVKYGTGLTLSGSTLIVDSTYINGLISAGATIPTNFIGGLVLSYNSSSVLNIAAGSAADSTNAALISLGAFTKSTAGAWVAGSGNHAMGNGLTIANSTWYHVILANNGGTPDIYFDTSATGANIPTGISDTKVRRIGSFQTDGSAHIISFVQVFDEFLWSVSVLDVNAYNVQSTAALQTLSVPLGVQVIARYRLEGSANTGTGFLVSSPDETDQTPSATLASFWMSSQQVNAELQTRTNTSSQVRVRGSSTHGTINITTYGWRDFRGQ
jgi:hypothetical protein